MIKLKVPGTPNRSKSKVSHPQRPHGRIRGSRPIPGPFKGLGQNTRILGVPERGHEHPQGWEQGEHHSTDPRTAENAPPVVSGLALWGPQLAGEQSESSAKEFEINLWTQTRRARHVGGAILGGPPKWPDSEPFRQSVVDSWYFSGTHTTPMERFTSCAAEEERISPRGPELSSRHIRRVAIWALPGREHQM